MGEKNKFFTRKIMTTVLAMTMIVSLSACGQEASENQDNALQSVEGTLSETVLASQSASNDTTATISASQAANSATAATTSASQPTNSATAAATSASQVFNITAEYSIGTPESTLGTGEWMPYVDLADDTDDIEAKLNTAINKVYNSSLVSEYVIIDNAVTDSQAREKVKKLYPLAERVSCAILYGTNDSSLTRMKSEWANVYEMSGVQEYLQQSSDEPTELELQISYARPIYAKITSSYTYVYVITVHNSLQYWHDSFSNLWMIEFDNNDVCTNIEHTRKAYTRPIQIIRPMLTTDEKFSANGNPLRPIWVFYDEFDFSIFD